jgi:hypothetical protein
MNNKEVFSGSIVAYATHEYYTLPIHNLDEGKGWKQIFIRPLTTLVYLGASALTVSETILRVALAILTLPALFSSDYAAYYSREFSLINTESNLHVSIWKSGELFLLAFSQLVVSNYASTEELGSNGALPDQREEQVVTIEPASSNHNPSTLPEQNLGQTPISEEVIAQEEPEPASLALVLAAHPESVEPRITRLFNRDAMTIATDALGNFIVNTYFFLGTIQTLASESPLLFGRVSSFVSSKFSGFSLVRSTSQSEIEKCDEMMEGLFYEKPDNNFYLVIALLVVFVASTSFVAYQHIQARQYS